MPDDLTTIDDPIETTTEPKAGDKKFASLADVDPEELNRFMSSKKRTILSQLGEARKEAAGLKSLQGQVQKALDSDLFQGVEIEGLEDWVEQAETTLHQFKSDAEISAEENKKLSRQRDKAFTERDDAVRRFNTAQIKRAVADHAVDRVLDADGLEYLELKLEPLSEVQDDGSVLVNWEVPDPDSEDGKLVPGKIAMESVIDSMFEQAAAGKRYRGVFKSTVQGGTGGKPGDGPKKSASTGGFDINEIISDPAKYQAAMAKDPAAVQEALANIKPFAE